MQVWPLCLVPILLNLTLTGCGSQAPSDCTPVAPSVRITPTSAVADHDAGVPGNQHQFVVTSTAAGSPGCATPALSQRLTPTWTTSDSLDIQISSAPDATNGLAICLGPTAGPATLTAHLESPLTATLFCY